MKNKITFLISLALLVALVFNPYGYNIFELPKVHFLAIFLSTILIILSFNFLHKGEINLRYNKFVVIFLGLWLLSLILSTVFSVAPQLSFWGSYERMQGMYSHIIYLGFFVIFLNFLKDKKAQDIFIKVAVAVATITAVYAIFQQFGVDIFTYESMFEQGFIGRSFATLGHPNFLGQFLIFPIWGAIYLAIQWKKSKKIFAILLTILLVTALLLTQNRASVLGLGAGVMFFLFFSPKIKPIYKYLLSFAIIAGFILFVIFFAPTVRSLFSRFLIWQGAIVAFMHHPVVGSGLETFKLLFQQAGSNEIFQLEHLYEVADRAHNEYLDILVTQGIFGLGVYLSIIFVMFRSVFKRLNDKLMLILGSALVSILVSIFFGFSLTVHFLILAAIFAIIINKTSKFKIIKIKNTAIMALIIGALVVFSVFNYINSTRSIYADFELKSGIDNLYSGDPTVGINEIITSANLNLHQEDIYFMLANMLLSSGEEEDAEKVLEYAGKYTNYDFKYYLLKAEIEAALENYKEAEDLFAKANVLAPVNPLILREWGRMYYAEKNYDMAIKKLEEYLEIIPEYWKWKNRTKDLTQENKAKYNQFFKDIPDFWDIFPDLCLSQNKTGNAVKANFYKEFTGKCSS